MRFLIELIGKQGCLICASQINNSAFSHGHSKHLSFDMHLIIWIICVLWSHAQSEWVRNNTRRQNTKIISPRFPQEFREVKTCLCENDPHLKLGLTSTVPGECVSGVCACDKGWSGEGCERDSCPNHCSGHGICNLRALGEES